MARMPSQANIKEGMGRPTKSQRQPRKRGLVDGEERWQPAVLFLSFLFRLRTDRFLRILTDPHEPVEPSPQANLPGPCLVVHSIRPDAICIMSSSDGYGSRCLLGLTGHRYPLPSLQPTNQPYWCFPPSLGWASHHPLHHIAHKSAWKDHSFLFQLPTVNIRTWYKVLSLPAQFESRSSSPHTSPAPPAPARVIVMIYHRCLPCSI
ncbi:hypothetical protein B0T10DRAFT_66683 [Thelonectria olida]|uniref:Uncharacterized protein n=1 Tax=Thelonectria olida TaxID=1576542 RepID=A0A9P9AL27_9HYPO|nr:hypothetical protein B0T10DRAFT_66683 [Thelonectria olida]